MHSCALQFFPSLSVHQATTLRRSSPTRAFIRRNAPFRSSKIRRCSSETRQRWPNAMSICRTVILFVTFTSFIVCDGEPVQEDTEIVGANVASNESMKKEAEEKLGSSEEEDASDKGASVFSKKPCDGRSNSWLISALKKIAKVASIDESKDGCGGERGFRASSKSVDNSPKHDGQRDFVQRFATADLGSSTIRVKRKYRCHAIRDVRVPGVAEKMPAYSCKLQNRTFILSSPRFLQDRRSYLDVDVDENIDQRLKNVANGFDGARISVVQAMLVLKLGDENYGLREQRDYSEETSDNRKLKEPIKGS